MLGPVNKEAHYLARAWITDSGYCSVMYDRLDKNAEQCKPMLYFSNPLVKYDKTGEKTGKFHANNALWITSQRFMLKNMGQERVRCDKHNYIFDKTFLHYIITTNETSPDLNSFFPHDPVWG